MLYIRCWIACLWWSLLHNYTWVSIKSKHFISSANFSYQFENEAYFMTNEWKLISFAREGNASTTDISIICYPNLYNLFLKNDLQILFCYLRWYMKIIYEKKYWKSSKTTYTMVVELVIKLKSHWRQQQTNVNLTIDWLMENVSTGRLIDVDY